MQKLFGVVALLVLSAAVVGQDKPAAKTKKPDEPVIVTKTSLPRYFKQLGLSDKQKKEVYKVRATYTAEVTKLREQIAALATKEKDDTEAILTEAQRARLKELRGSK